MLSIAADHILFDIVAHVCYKKLEKPSRGYARSKKTNRRGNSVLKNTTVCNKKYGQFGGWGSVIRFNTLPIGLF